MCLYSRGDSNANCRFRRPKFYPLNYGSVLTGEANLSPSAKCRLIRLLGVTKSSSYWFCNLKLTFIFRMARFSCGTYHRSSWPFQPTQVSLSVILTTKLPCLYFTTPLKYFHSCDPDGARTRDPDIKSVVLYQLSYRVFHLIIVLLIHLMLFGNTCKVTSPNIHSNNNRYRNHNRPHHRKRTLLIFVFNSLSKHNQILRILWEWRDSNPQCLPRGNGFTDRCATKPSALHSRSFCGPDGTRTHNHAP